MDSSNLHKLQASYTPFGGFGSTKLLCHTGAVVDVWSVVLHVGENILIHLGSISIPIFMLSVVAQSREEAEALGHDFLDTLDTLAFIQPVVTDATDEADNCFIVFYFLCDAVELTSKSKISNSKSNHAVVNDEKFLGTIIGDVRCQKKKK